MVFGGPVRRLFSGGEAGIRTQEAPFGTYAISSRGDSTTLAPLLRVSIILQRGGGIRRRSWIDLCLDEFKC